MTRPADDLARLAQEFWVDTLAATRSRLPPRRARSRRRRRRHLPEAVERERLRLLDVAARARAIPESGLDRRRARDADLPDRGDRGRGGRARAEHLDDWTVDVVNGWPTAIQNVPSFQTADTPDGPRPWSSAGAVRRPHRPAHGEPAARPAADGRVATHAPVARAIDALTTTLAMSDDESALLEPLRPPRGRVADRPGRRPSEPRSPRR